MPNLVAPPAPSSPQPSRARWTVDEFHGFASSPIFENRKMILVDGEILSRSLANHPHDMGIASCFSQLNKIFDASAYWIRVQMALPLGQSTDPGPDIAVILGAWRTHASQPSFALLVIEVSDSSLDYDTGDKSNLYATGGILDYWVVDVNGKQLIVFRNPVADSAAPFGFRYQSRLNLDPSAVVSPLAAPQAVIRVADLLP